MADTPTPNPGTPSGGGGSEATFLKAFAKIGVKIDSMTEQEVKKALTPLQRYMSDFNKTTDMKNTFFGKLPGIRQMLINMQPDTVRFTNQLALMGAVSRAGGDNNQEFYNSLNLVGKLLARTVGEVELMSGAMGMLGTVLSIITSVGVGLLVTGLLAVSQGLWNTIKAAVLWQNKLNEISISMGGIAKDRIMLFNSEFNNTLTSLSGYGFALGDTLASIKGYIANGLNPAIATNAELTKTTLQLSAVTGQSSAEMAAFWAGIQRGSKLITSDFTNLGNAFTSFNASAEKSGVIGTISFNQVKEAISFVGTALLIAANRGSAFTQRLTADLMGLAGLANALNISITELNGKFEESGNLVSLADSPFRALLAISGGANIQDMLSNQFNRTDAMLKISDKLSQLSVQFGGNLNIMGQVAAQAFGVSKDMAIKFATMSSEQKRALEQAKNDAMMLNSGGLDKAWENVTATLSTTMDRLKNTVFTMFQRAFSGNSGIQQLLSNIGDKIHTFTTELTQPNSPLSKIVDSLSGILNRMFTWFNDEFLPGFGSRLDKIVKWVGDTFTVFTKDGFWSGVIKIFKDAFIELFTDLLPLILKTMLGIGVIIADSIIYGLQIAVPWFTKGKPEDLGTTITKHLESIFGPIDRSSKENTFAITKSNEMMAVSNRLKLNEQESSRYAGMQDTDLVVNKEGQFSLAGIERNKIEEQHQKLLADEAEATRLNTKAVEENNRLLAIGQSNENLREAQHFKPVPAITPIMEGTVGATTFSNYSFLRNGFRPN